MTADEAPDYLPDAAKIFDSSDEEFATMDEQLKAVYAPKIAEQLNTESAFFSEALKEQQAQKLQSKWHPWRDFRVTVQERPDRDEIAFWFTCSGDDDNEPVFIYFNDEGDITFNARDFYEGDPTSAPPTIRLPWVLAKAFIEHIKNYDKDHPRLREYQRQLTFYRHQVEALTTTVEAQAIALRAMSEQRRRGDSPSGLESVMKSSLTPMDPPEPPPF